MSAIAIDPLIAEAKARARRRRWFALVAAGLIAVGLLAFELAPSGAGGGAHGVSDTIPWLPTKPDLGPAHPPLAPPCTASQLHAAISWAGLAGSLAGEIDVVNRSSTPCALVGRPKLWVDGRSATKYGPNPSRPYTLDPLAPPIGSLRAFAPGRRVVVGLWWGDNLCAIRGASGILPYRPKLTAPGDGQVPLDTSRIPPCYVGSVPQATRFIPFVATGPRRTALPLNAWISSPNGKHTATPPYLAAHVGSWLSFTVVLKNTSERAFRFGRTCPSYTEGVVDSWMEQNQAYVLNCHAVGVIAPRRSVRFAMRVHVPAGANDNDALWWTLAPHSYNAAGALAFLEYH